ncbi:MAG: DNA-formamidopyrimidine glycosylase family protein [Verrucomicrobiota bacterium]
MPELPDITIYIEALQRRILERSLAQVRLANPFLLRSVTPPVAALVGRKVTNLRRVGKRIAIGFEGDLWMVLHLMIAGRLHWHGTDAGTTKPRKGIAAFEFSNGTLVLTEAGTKRRASLLVTEGEAGLQSIDPGGVDGLTCSNAQFGEVLASRNHTLKRALTDPRLFSGIGNAYSDEILHRARLSPVALTQSLSAASVNVLFEAVRSTLGFWIDLLRREAGDTFPEGVTAFRPEMAVHGKFGKPCPVCGTKVQRIRYAENETNYCPGCQTKGKLLADRSLSLLLKKDWPKTVEELEELRRGK